MKKILSCVMALSIAATAAMYASAADITESSAPKTGTKEVELTQASSYTVEIPDATKVTLTPGEDTSIGSAQVKAALLAEDEVIDVTVSSADNEWTMDLADTSKGTELTYTVKADGTEKNSGDKIIDGATAAGAAVALTVNAETPTVAGTYNDTLTFTVTCK